MIESIILSAVLKERTAWTCLAGHVDKDDFTRHGWLVWEAIDTYYTVDDDAKSVGVDVLRETLKREYPRQMEPLGLILEELDLDISTPNVLKTYIDLKLDVLDKRLSMALVNRDMDEVDALIAERSALAIADHDDATDVLMDVDIEELVESLQPDQLIRVAPDALNDRLDGGLVPGHQVAIYAPTEVGKTLFAVNLVCSVLKQGYKVLYVGNEDPAKLTLLRAVNNLTGRDKWSVLADPSLATHEARQEGYGNLIMMDASPGSVPEIRALIEKHHPAVVVVDQMANLEAGKNLSKTEKNEHLATQLRNLAKKYGHVSAIVHQASESAYGKAVLQKQDMYYSNVGVQGQMDVMIGIGMTTEHEAQGLRMLCLVKNKVNGDHSSFPVKIDEKLSRIVE